MADPIFDWLSSLPPEVWADITGQAGTGAGAQPLAAGASAPSQPAAPQAAAPVVPPAPAPQAPAPIAAPMAAPAIEGAGSGAAGGPAPGGLSPEMIRLLLSTIGAGGAAGAPGRAATAAPGAMRPGAPAIRPPLGAGLPNIAAPGARRGF